VVPGALLLELPDGALNLRNRATEFPDLDTVKRSPFLRCLVVRLSLVDPSIARSLSEHSIAERVQQR
jgi:hypothetical protein